MAIAASLSSRKFNTLVQGYDRYTEEDKQVWKVLFERQMKILPVVASPEYLEGIEQMGFNADELPNFDKINARLAELTDWNVVAVPGFIEPVDFFPLLANKKFPATTWLRKMDELDFLPEPDMFHDVIGHLPLLSNQVFCNFFQKIGELGCQYLHKPKAVSMLGGLYWYAVEFGLIRSEQDELKVYGAGVLSSYGEIKSALSASSEYIPFDAERILNMSYDDSHVQERYFVIDSFDQLYNAMDEIKEILDRV